MRESVRVDEVGCLGPNPQPPEGFLGSSQFTNNYFMSNLDWLHLHLNWFCELKWTGTKRLTQNDAIFLQAWPFPGLGSNVFSSLQYGCLMTQVRFFVSVPLRGSRWLSTVKKPSDSTRVSTTFPSSLQLMLAAGFPLSALHTATTFPRRVSHVAEILGQTEKRRSEQDIREFVKIDNNSAVFTLHFVALICLYRAPQ